MTPNRLKELFEAHYGPLVRYIDSMVNNQEDSRDIVSEAFVKYWQADPEEGPDPERWLYRVGRNLAIDLLRRRSFLHKWMETPKEEQDNSEEWEREAARLCFVLQKSESLPERCRAIFRLYLAGVDTKDIVRQLGTSTQNALNQKARAIKLLRRKILTP